MGKGSVYGTLMDHITPSRSLHNALHSPSLALEIAIQLALLTLRISLTEFVWAVIDHK